MESNTFRQITKYTCTSLSGVENNNDVERNYFPLVPNLHDVTGEAPKAEWRIEQTEHLGAQNRSRTKEMRTTGKDHRDMKVDVLMCYSQAYTAS